MKLMLVRSVEKSSSEGISDRRISEWLDLRDAGEMDDATAYMALALNNAQGELSPLEVGLHTLHSGLSQTEYGKQMGLSQPSISIRMRAAEVADITRVINADSWRHLAEIHAAPRWLWRALVAQMVADGWTVEATRKAVAGVKDAPAPGRLLNRRRPSDGPPLVRRLQANAKFGGLSLDSPLCPPKFAGDETQRKVLRRKRSEFFNVFAGPFRSIVCWSYCHSCLSRSDMPVR
jgi:ParB-like chromosome segregation protein Spo0J